MARILLVFPGALGDLVLLAPAAAALARRARVETSVCRGLAPVAAALVPGAAGPAADGADVGTIFAAPSAALRAWVEGADLVHAWLGAGRDDVGRGLREAGARAVRCHAVVRGDGPRHASADYAAALEVSGRLDPPACAAADPCPLAWTAAPGARLVVHPGAGSAAKRWPVEGMRAVADAWRARGGEIVVLLGPAEEDDRERWRASGHRVASGLALGTAAALVASAPRYLGNDSGISHLAGALGRRGVVLFGPTRPERWRPLGGRLRPLGFAAAPSEVVGALAASYLDTPTADD